MHAYSWRPEWANHPQIVLKILTEAELNADLHTNVF